eukprot:Ihof_evm1s467 gene=Ihof_evmTU1s467
MEEPHDRLLLAFEKCSQVGDALAAHDLTNGLEEPGMKASESAGYYTAVFQAIADLCLEGDFEMSPSVSEMENTFNTLQKQLNDLKEEVAKFEDNQRHRGHTGDYGIYRLEEDLDLQVEILRKKIKEAKNVVESLNEAQRNDPILLAARAKVADNKHKVELLTDQLDQLGAGNPLDPEYRKLWELKIALTAEVKAKDNVASIIEHDQELVQLRKAIDNKQSDADQAQHRGMIARKCASSYMEDLWALAGLQANKENYHATILMLLAEHE